jgi:cytochrome c oxidase assembly protein subunit 11
VTAQNTSNANGRAGAQRHLLIAFVCGAVAFGMVGLSFAAVPLYRLYCQVTGYAGTTQRAEKASGTVLDRTVTVHFDSNVASNLPWRFEPQQRKVDIKAGENTLAFYRAVNTSDRAITGTAVFNVTPEVFGVYFNKVECFCFTEQTLEPGQSIDMPVSFYVDPKFVEDEDAKVLTELTLSYTFYAVDKPQGEEKLGQKATDTAGKDG